jgi:hypothetical protein
MKALRRELEQGGVPMSAWRKSSFSDTPNSCVEVRHESDVVYVRDSKLGDDSPVLRFAAASWLVLTDAIVAPRDGDPWKIVHRSIAYEPDGHVLLSTSDRSPELRFDADEWKAFVYGVRAGEFDPEKLSEEVTSEPGCDGSDKAATGAVEEGCRTPGSAVPVAAPLNVPAGRPGEDTPPVSPGLPAVNGQPGLIQYEDEGSDRSRGMRCGQCDQYTGNNHQGHYWKWCKVTGQMETFHFCCPGACDRADAWRHQYELLIKRFAELGVKVDDTYASLISPVDKRWRSLLAAAKAIDNDAEAWTKAVAPLVPAVETQETVS